MPKSWWDKHFGDNPEKRDNARKVIKNMTLNMIQKLVNEMDPNIDKDKINEITQLALGGKCFDPNFKPTGNFKTAIEEIAGQKNELNFFHRIFGTSTYKKHENAANLVNKNASLSVMGNGLLIEKENLDIESSPDDDSLEEEKNKLVPNANDNANNIEEIINDHQSQIAPSNKIPYPTRVNPKIAPIIPELTGKEISVSNPERQTQEFSVK